MNFLITGSAGFIGFHLAMKLLKDGHMVHGFDGITDYYDQKLKRSRHNVLLKNSNLNNEQVKFVGERYFKKSLA